MNSWQVLLCTTEGTYDLDFRLLSFLDHVKFVGPGHKVLMEDNEFDYLLSNISVSADSLSRLFVQYIDNCN